MDARRRRPELMDDPSLDVTEHRRALRALERINRISGAAPRVWSEVVELHRRSGEPVRVLDVACGGGDVLVDVARRATRSGVPVELTGCDLSPVALEHARTSMDRVVAGGDGPPTAWIEMNVLRDPLPEGHDLVTSNLFLHHLADAHAVDLMARMAQAAQGGLLVQDLRRTRRGYLLAWLGLHTLTTSRVARIDGLRSVLAAFDLPEVHRLCSDARLEGARIQGVWPQRWVVRWRAGR